ncbi:MAG TPA: 2-amino-4-hydroxy-6-hydroxymethyldihydropteridine diphosphokinase [Longimicrobiales bacterium]|nr:2-amino-4-hydroxy-6-hydroxymethyldihydropteridine diphosphokinase [Longimicrobiales bacterium]
MAEVYIGLGSNVGNTAGHLREAVTRLAGKVSIEGVSSVYWTEPVGLRDQPYFLNAVLHARTQLEPREVLAVLKGVEGVMGRQREVPLGPRIIDLDLLLYDELRLDEPGITLPHPRMDGRRFVLEPLAEIAPGVRLERGGPTVAELLAELSPGESVERLLLPDWPPGI